MRLPADVPGSGSSASPSELLRLQVDDPRWAEFVSSRPEATPFHDPAWAAFIADTYGFRPFALCVQRAGVTVAGLAVIELRTPLGRRRWVSLPFTDECAPLGDLDDDVPERFDTARSDAGIRSFEVRAPFTGGFCRPRGVTHQLSLGEDLDRIMRGYRSSIRQGIRAAERADVVVRRAERPSELTDTFYAMHVATRRRLGVPVQRRRYFAELWERIIDSGKGFVLLAERSRMPLAGAVFLQANGIVVYKYGASDASHWRLRPNNALFHHAISCAAQDGCGLFDWGRTDFEDQGLRRFKSSWGAVERELVYTTLGAESSSVGGGRAAAVAQVVIRHSPAAVGRALGAMLYRYAG